jgi:uncharacterized protein YcgI (DUF1989 family)
VTTGGDSTLPGSPRRLRPRTPPPDRLVDRYPGTAAEPAHGFIRLAPQTGTGLELYQGQTLTIVDPMGEQVSDFFCFAAADHAEWFSTGRTIDYKNSLYVGSGDLLYSNRSSVMATIVSDTCGVHDMTLTPCSQQTFDLLYPEFDGAEHPSCFANLAGAFAPFGISADQISTTLNIFMDVWTDLDGELHIDPPPSRPGDQVTLRAEIDLVVGITACSAEKSNHGVCKPVDFRVAR